MSQTANVDGFQITVPAGWWIWKYDDSSFHRNQFQKFSGGSKAVDALALSGNGTLWLIEVKDYRHNKRTKPSSVFAEMASKVRSTLAGLAVARVKANDRSEKQLAEQAMRCRELRVALQVVQPTNPSRLFPQVIEPQDAQIQLRKALRPVDPHAMCAAGAPNDNRLPWTTA